MAVVVGEAFRAQPPFPAVRRGLCKMPETPGRTGARIRRFEAGGFVSHTSLGHLHLHVPIAKLVCEGALGCIDGQLVEIRAAQPQQLRIKVGEQPALQQRIIGEVDAGHDVGGTERHLLGLREQIVRIAGATIRAVSRGVIGISVLQAILAGLGLIVAGVPGASLITSAVLILGIIQIGPSIVLIPVIIWSWTTMEATAALLFTAYMIPVNLLDNVLRPVVMGRGLETPTLVILIGVIGGTISYGITGLFLGPIILAVIWELLEVWIRESEEEHKEILPGGR